MSYENATQSGDHHQSSTSSPSINQQSNMWNWWPVAMFAPIFDHLTQTQVLYAIMTIFIIWFMVYKFSNIFLRFKGKGQKSDDIKWTQEELEEKLNSWHPDPLTPKIDTDHYALNPRTISSIYGKQIMVDGKQCLNLATHNYLGFAEDSECIQDAIDTVKVYGVGSCGPRGFFGTFDIHLKLEEEISRFMKTEEAILYSYGYSAISSAIPAYSKNKDIIFVDEQVNFAIQQGLIASRSKIIYFKHNDVNDLERLLMEQHNFDLANPKLAKKISRFMVVEGLYINTGDICPLPQIIELKRKYKVRLFIDDTCGFGVLGKNGRGIVEHFGVNMEDIDLIAASLEYSCASYGGFCTGTHYVIDHQRLCGLGYCFSASLPPLQAAYAHRAIKKIQQHPELLEKLQHNCKLMHELLKEEHVQKLIHLQSDHFSPIKHIRFAEPADEWIQNGPSKTDVTDASTNNVTDASTNNVTDASTNNVTDINKFDTKRLEAVVQYAYEQGYALTVARYLERAEHKLPAPSIRLVVNSMLTPQEIVSIQRMLVDAFHTVRQRFFHDGTL